MQILWYQITANAKHYFFELTDMFFIKQHECISAIVCDTDSYVWVINVFCCASVFARRHMGWSFFFIISTLSNFFFYQQDFPNYLLSYFIALSFPHPTLLFIISLAISIIQSSHSPAPLLTKVSHTQSLPLYQRSVCIGKLQSCKLFSTVDLFCTLLKSQSSL